MSRYAVTFGVQIDVNAENKEHALKRALEIAYSEQLDDYFDDNPICIILSEFNSDYELDEEGEPLL